MKPKYEYHPKDAYYLQRNGLCRLNNYVDLIVHANKLGCDSFVDGVRRAYDTTQSSRKAGKLMGVSWHSVVNHLRRLGHPIRGRGGFHRESAEVFEGKPCRRCGSTIRYASNGNCRNCQINDNKRNYERRKNESRLRKVQQQENQT